MTIHFSKHAVERYRERVKPHERVNHVRRELKRLAPLCEVATVRPGWVTPHGNNDCYLIVADGVVFPLTQMPNGDWMAPTCLFRSWRPSTNIEAKRAAKADRKAQRDWRARGRASRDFRAKRRAA